MFDLLHNDFITYRTLFITVKSYTHVIFLRLCIASKLKNVNNSVRGHGQISIKFSSEPKSNYFLDQDFLYILC